MYVISTLNFQSGENNSRGACIVGDYLYVACATSPGKIVKIDLTTFTEVATLTFETGENNTVSIGEYDGFLYANCAVAPGKIVKVNLSNFTRVGVCTLSPLGNTRGIAIKDGFLYCSNTGPQPRAVKVDLSSFTEVSSIAVDGRDFGEAIEIVGNYLYIGCWYQSVGTYDHSIIDKIDLATFSTVDHLEFPSGMKWLWHLHGIGDKLYCGFHLSPTRIGRVDLSTFSHDATLILSMGNGMYKGLATALGNLFAVNATPPCYLTKIVVATFTQQTPFSVSPTQGCVDVVVNDKYFYITIDSVPGSVKKVALRIKIQGNGLGFAVCCDTLGGLVRISPLNTK